MQHQCRENPFGRGNHKWPWKFQMARSEFFRVREQFVPQKSVRMAPQDVGRWPRGVEGVPACGVTTSTELQLPGMEGSG